MQALHKSYHEAGDHQQVDGRDIGRKDHAGDFATDGALKVIQGKVLPRWVDGRTYTRGTRENWDVLGGVDYDFDSDDEDGRDGGTAGRGQDSSIGEGGRAAGVGKGTVVDD